MGEIESGSTPAVGMVGAFPFPHSQGSQVLAEEQCRYLAGAGFRVYLFAYNIGSLREHSGVTVVRPPRLPGYRKMRAGPSPAKPLQNLLLLFTILKKIKELDLDLLHAHNYEAGIVAALASRIRKIPWVYQPHGMLEEEIPAYFRRSVPVWIARRFGRLFDRLLPRRAGMVFAMHSGLGNAVNEVGVDIKNIRILPPAVDVDTFIPGPPHGYLVRRKEINEGPTIIYTGNLDRYQDLGLLSEAFVRVKAEIPTARLLIVTESDPADFPLPAGADALRGVEFRSTGDFKEIKELLHSADIAVCPRRTWSGFPVKIVNYLAAGKPVVASKGSVQYMDSLDGVISPRHDTPESFADALLKCLTDREVSAELSLKSEQNARLRYSWEAVGPALQAAYHDTLKITTDQE